MSENQLHLTHRPEYLRGTEQGKRDALADRDYRPRDGARGSQDAQQAYSLGYMDGYAS
jgi:hypothetical protein